MICAQYYMLLRMGRRGFELVAQSTTQVHSSARRPPTLATIHSAPAIRTWGAHLG